MEGWFGEFCFRVVYRGFIFEWGFGFLETLIGSVVGGWLESRLDFVVFGFFLYGFSLFSLVRVFV